MRRPLVVANWKMNGNLADNRKLLQSFLASWQGVHHAEVGICPPAVYLPQAIELLGQTNVELGAQDVSAAENGAFTGEVSAAMLADIGCQFALVGHSERREYHAESDQLVARKFKAAQSHKLTPILCIGESLQQREAGETLMVVGEQLKAVIDEVGRAAIASSVIAYEPVWAIGTGLTATPEQAQEVHAFIREQLGAVGNSVRILYGGSVKPSNAAELFSQADIDGALVGGASLNSDDFYSICQAAE
ncbi:triose-phosphate isomerase [Aestuariicella hydrocarbonica]|uniref:Triosephosphate isomerase n=1 Tax=Pseudomaricurvus hydrocarbonicus TaxID=1470433 RepID=A0A9E5MK31_9GAMM|nr:triose-phosphate isomerase [Aestuariicella hydrocarbonica]NHO64822.1 triose-phosphate isomerase [Aestuariicella hydrocarbonica]